MHYLLNPISNFPIFFIGVLLSQKAPDVINKSSTTWEFILYILFQQTFISSLKFSHFLFGIWLIYSICYMRYSSIIEGKDKEIKKLEENLNEANNSLKNEAALLLSRYSDLARFKINDILFQNVKRFVDSNPLIHSAQIYKYSITKYQDKSCAKIYFDNGYASESVNINAIMQAYYYMPSNLLEKIFRIKYLYEWIENGGAQELEQSAYIIYDEIDNIAKEIMDEAIPILEEKEKKISENKENISFNDIDIGTYSILKTLIQLLYEDDNNNDDKAKITGSFLTKIFVNPENEKGLYSIKRTGILESILNQDYSIFKHQGKSDKNGRVYISKSIILNDENYILLLSLDSSIIERYEWKQELIGLSCELEEILKNSFKVV